ncbi:MAG: ROK family protein [Oligoflexia bacterium]|nr:ROK family protein [Oligoflexia bacterium]
MLQNNKHKLTVIGVDVGGTKIAIGPVLINDDDQINKKGDSLISYHNYPTNIEEIIKQKDTSTIREKFTIHISSLILKVIEETESKGYIVHRAIGLGSPGNIINGVISAKTTPQFGDAFNDFDISKALSEKISALYNENKNRIRSKFIVIAHNDALAQMAFGISELIQNKEYAELMNNQKVAYIGPGTGLGGGFANVHINNINSNIHSSVKLRANLQFFTDGHIGDIIVGYDKDGTPLWAEFELLSGMYISRKTNGLTGKDLAAQIDKHLPFIEELGDNLGKIIYKIHTGDVYKARKTTLWSDEDRSSVRGISIFIIGGSIGTKGRMGEIIRTRAKKYLDNILNANVKNCSNQIKIIPILSDSAYAGVIGAANFVQL